MSLEDKLTKLYEYDSDIEGGERHKKDWINHASDLLRESLPAPSEPAKSAMELAEAVTDLCVVDDRGAIYYDTAAAAALIQSSFEAWSKSSESEEGVNDILCLDCTTPHHAHYECRNCGARTIAPRDQNYCAYCGNRWRGPSGRLLIFSSQALPSFRQSASEPSGEEAFAQAVGEVLRKEHAFDNDEVIEVLSGASALLASRAAPTDKKAPTCMPTASDVVAMLEKHGTVINRPKPTDEKALKMAARVMAKKWLAYPTDSDFLEEESLTNCLVEFALSHESPKDETARNADGTPYGGVLDGLSHESPKEQV